MGDWHLSIVGTGIHHNGLAGDADQVFKRAVADLEKAGHILASATFTSGGRTTADQVQELPAPAVANLSPTPPPAGEPGEAAKHQCPQCGAYFDGPATCTNGHPPAETVDLEQEKAAGDAGAPPPAAGSPDWPAGS